jgi:hypothetical protein
LGGVPFLVVVKAAWLVSTIVEVELALELVAAVDDVNDDGTNGTTVLVTPAADAVDVDALLLLVTVC